MAIKSKEEIIQAISDRIGEDNSDDALALIEDVTDTLNDYDTKVSDTTDWETKYNTLDQEWREKYKARFTQGADDNNSSIDNPESKNNDNNNDNLDDKYKPKMYKYEDLFKTEE